MKIFILSPNIDVLFTQELKKKLDNSGEVIYIKEVKPIKEITALFEGNEERVLAIDPDYFDWKFPMKVIDKIPNLQAICLQTTSFSWADVKYAKKKSIPVMNLRGFSTKAVAEWAVMMVMNVARKVPFLVKNEWKCDYAKHQGIELEGKTAGIIGLGNIGTRIAEICDGLGMKVVYWSKKTKDKRFKYINLDMLMKSSDVILPALAQNDETSGLVTDDMVKTMKKSAIFVSIAHHVYNHDLLLKLAEEGQIYGYGFEDSKAKIADFKGNVWAGPELAWCTDGSMKRNAIQWVDAITKAVEGKHPTKVN